MSPHFFPVLVLVAALAWVLDLAVGSPWPITAGACAPAAVYVFAVTLAQRRSGRPPAELALAFLWGAVGASALSTTFNILARQWVSEVAGGDHARALTATLLAPGIEEAAKALGILLIVAVRPAAIRSARDGIVYGALIGIGFVCTENVLYLGYAVLQGGEGGLVRAVYMRGLLFGGTHAVFTACVGAGIGRARAMRIEASGRVPSGSSIPRAAMVAVLSFVVAVAQHVAWNTAASELINRALCGAAVLGEACRDAPPGEALFVWAPLWSGAFLAPGCAALWLAGRDRRRSRR